MLYFYGKDLRIHIKNPNAEISLCGFPFKKGQWTHMTYTRTATCPACCRIVLKKKWASLMEELTQNRVDLRPDATGTIRVAVTVYSNIWPEVQRGEAHHDVVQ